MQAEPVGGTTLRFTFPPQTSVGDYTVIAGQGLASDIFGQPMSQSYTGHFSITLPLIQGQVTNSSGEPVRGVLMQPNFGSPALTDENGRYSVGAPPGIVLRVTPSLNTLVFIPGTRTYTDVTTSLGAENYLAVDTIVPATSWQQQGTNLVFNWFGIPGVSYQWYSSTNLSDWLPCGEVIPGTNGPLQVTLPVEADPSRFYRLRASN